MRCVRCGEQVDQEFRFCPWCATPQAGKAVAQFQAHPDVSTPGRGLRVSRYFDPELGPPHTRLSIYDEDGRVLSVIALDDLRTSQLSAFLGTLADDAPTERLSDPLSRLIDRLDPRV